MSCAKAYLSGIDMPLGAAYNTDKRYKNMNNHECQKLYQLKEQEFQKDPSLSSMLNSIEFYAVVF